MDIQSRYDSSDIYETLPNVARRLGFSRYQIRLMCKAGEFPAPIRFTRQRLVFRRSEVEAWIRQRERANWQQPRANVERPLQP